MNRYDLDVGLQTFLASVSAKNVGLGTVPPSLTLPYGILYPINTSRGEGSWADPEEDRWFIYQVTSVGEDPRQCGWLSDKVREAFIGRGPGSGYLWAPGIAGINVQVRESEALGAIIPGGENLWQVQDVYRVKVGK